MNTIRKLAAYIDGELGSQYAHTEARLMQDPEFQRVTREAELEELNNPTSYIKRNLRAILIEQAMPSYRVSTPGTISRVPNQPKTRTRTFRIPDALYESAQQAAEANGETVTDVVRRALERYVKAQAKK